MQKRVNQRGFTLVELVVVIAVLAILAGVGVVAYNGYIEKAREAADLDLLGAVNTAFASACAENGVEGLPEKTFTLGGENVTIGTNGAVHLVNQLLPDLTDSESLNSAFDRYYEGNENTKFKVFETLIYDPATGGFGGQYGNVTILGNNWKMVTKDNGNGSHTYTVTDGDGKTHNYTVQDEDLAAYQDSNYGNMPVSELMSDVNSIVDAMQSAMMGGMINYNYKSLGIDENDYKKPDGSFDKEAADRAAANACVLMVAKQTTSGGFDYQKYITDTLINGKPSQSGIDYMWSQYALDITLATSFANSEYGSQEITMGGQKKTVAQHYADQLKKLQELTAAGANMEQFNKEIYLFNMDKTDLFKEYYKEHGEQDLNAYTSTLSAITQNDQAVRDSGVLESGWNDSDFGAILDAVFGGGTTAP